MTLVHNQFFGGRRYKLGAKFHQILLRSYRVASEVSLEQLRGARG